jgi:hypothetical protein
MLCNNCPKKITINKNLHTQLNFKFKPRHRLELSKWATDPFRAAPFEFRVSSDRAKKAG